MAYNSWILDFRIGLRHLIVDLEILIMSPSFDNFFLQYRTNLPKLQIEKN